MLSHIWGFSPSSPSPSPPPPLPQIPVSPLALRSPILFWIWETGGNNERFSTSWGLTLDQTALSLPTLYKYPANIKWVSVSVVWDVAWWRPNVGQMRSRQQQLTKLQSYLPLGISISKYCDPPWQFSIGDCLFAIGHDLFPEPDDLLDWWLIIVCLLHLFKTPKVRFL